MPCTKLKTYMETGRVIFLPARSIRPNPAQPRSRFDPQALEELSRSIEAHGVIQPLSVRRVDNSYELIAGERRLRAAKMAGLTEVPCIIMHMDDGESGLVALVENLQRQDLDYIEQARGISQLIRLQGLSQEQAAKLLGKSQSAVANKLRLLRHSEQVLDMLRSADLTERHARALLRLQTEEEKCAAIAAIAARSMSVAQAEAYIESLLQSSQERQRRGMRIGSFLNSLSNSLARMQSAGVGVVSTRRETDREIQLNITISKQPLSAAAGNAALSIPSASRRAEDGAPGRTE